MRCAPRVSSATIVETPDSARTAVEAAAAVGASVGQIVKSLVFLCDDQPVLALVAGDNRLDEAAPGERSRAAAIGRADAARVREHTGFAIGGVAPLGSLEPLPVFCDADLLPTTTCGPPPARPTRSSASSRRRSSTRWARRSPSSPSAHPPAGDRWCARGGRKPCPTRL